MVFSRMVLQMDHIFQNIHARYIMLVRDIISARWAVNRIAQWGFDLDSLHLQDSCNIALSQMVLYVGHIGQYAQAHEGHG